MSGQSAIDIANLALSYCETGPIASFDDPVQGARVMKVGYNLLLDSLQRSFRWNFTRKYAVIPALADQPVFEYEYAYQLPADYLRLELAGSLSTGSLPQEAGNPPSALAAGISLPGVDLTDFQNGRSQDYRVVGNNQIYAHLRPPLAIVYAARVTDVNLFDVSFRECFACWLAWKLGPRINSSLGKKRDLKEDFQLSLRSAIAAKAVELPPRHIPDDTWTLSRVAK